MLSARPGAGAFAAGTPEDEREKMSRIGVMVCGHGSRDTEAITEFESVATGIRARLPRYDVESGFLEFATPVIREGLDKLHARGNELCLAVPGMLFAAGHAKNDIPSVLNTFEAQHPGMEIRYARELGLDDKLLRAAGDRIRGALDAAGGAVPLHETMLVVVGRGASDPGREQQCRQGDAHAVGGLRLRLGRDRLLRSHLSPRRAGASERGEARLPAYRRVPLVPVHRGARQAHLRP